MAISSGVGIPHFRPVRFEKCLLELPSSSVGVPEGTIPLFLDGVLESTKSKILSAFGSPREVSRESQHKEEAVL